MQRYKKTSNKTKKIVIFFKKSISRFIPPHHHTTPPLSGKGRQTFPCEQVIFLGKTIVKQKTFAAASARLICQMLTENKFEEDL
jgi:hypothetical protein